MNNIKSQLEKTIGIRKSDQREKANRNHEYTLEIPVGKTSLPLRTT